ncbi:multiple cyclophane-containing RiPP AmcA, partial [Actinokineospora iranica]|uniref:multiple cyclophane-containing RiPP AmcA n=1 Tax=Actinokineospora iranica TaxID=1271860 RepID=UPI001E61FBB2
LPISQRQHPAHDRESFPTEHQDHMLRPSEAALLSAAGTVPQPTGKWNNDPAWDNVTGGGGFDNRPGWDNWSNKR